MRLKSLYGLCMIIALAAILFVTGVSFAADQGLSLAEFADIQAAKAAVDTPAEPEAPAVILQSGGLTVTSPMETAAVGFWFPGDGAYAAGIAHTFLRVSHSALPKVTLDIDATIAQEVNQGKDSLGGMGFKVGYDIISPTGTGFSFAPSLGLTLLNDFAKYKTLEDIVTHYRLAVYGSAVLYKW